MMPSPVRSAVVVEKGDAVLRYLDQHIGIVCFSGCFMRAGNAIERVPAEKAGGKSHVEQVKHVGHNTDYTCSYWQIG